MPGAGMTMKEFLAQAGLRETGAMDDVAQAARDAATVLEVGGHDPWISLREVPNPGGVSRGSHDD